MPLEAPGQPLDRILVVAERERDHRRVVAPWAPGSRATSSRRPSSSGVARRYCRPTPPAPASRSHARSFPRSPPGRGPAGRGRCRVAGDAVQHGEQRVRVGEGRIEIERAPRGHECLGIPPRRREHRRLVAQDDRRERIELGGALVLPQCILDPALGLQHRAVPLMRGRIVGHQRQHPAELGIRLGEPTWLLSALASARCASATVESSASARSRGRDAELG